MNLLHPVQNHLNICMTIKFKDLTNKKFGKLTVIKKYTHRDNSRAILWVCQCVCGKIKNIRGTSLTSGVSKSCGCGNKGKTWKWSPEKIRSKPEKEKKVRKRNVYNGFEKSVLKRYEKRAKRKNLDWALTTEQAMKLFKNNCHYCGEKPSSIATTKTCSLEFVYNGIDRMNNSEGYTLNNCVSCCKHCNTAKNTFNKKEYINFIKSVYIYNFNTEL